MKLKTFIMSAIAVLGMATPAFAKDKATNNTDKTCLLTLNRSPLR